MKNEIKFSVGDLVGVNESDVVDLLDERTVNSSLRKFNVLRTAKVVFIGPYYVTIRYTKVKIGSDKRGGWCEAISNNDLHKLTLLKGGEPNKCTCITNNSAVA